MHWKNELIEYEKDVRAFMSRHLQAAGIKSPDVTVENNIGFYVAAHTASGAPILAFQLTEYAGKACFEINNFEVFEPFTKRGLGALAFKCALPALHERKKTHFLISLADETALGFWFHFGAITESFSRLAENPSKKSRYSSCLLCPDLEHTRTILKERLGALPPARDVAPFFQNMPPEEHHSPALIHRGKTLSLA